MTVVSTHPHVDTDDVEDWEADEPPAFHIYEVKRRTTRSRLVPHHLASCDGDAVMFILQTLHQEGQLTNESRVGILYRPALDTTGFWIVNPFVSGRPE